VSEGLPGFRASDRRLCEAYDAALVDLDGVVYVGSQPVPGAAAALDAARAAGLRVVFVTNNAFRTPQDVAAKLVGVGVAAGPEDVVTSAQAVGRMLAERFPVGSPVLVVGGNGLRSEVLAAGMTPAGQAGDGRTPVAVVQGFAPDVDWRLLAEASVAVRAGAAWIASNMDITLPSPRGPLPGNGSLVGVVRAATGTEPEVAGKPYPPLHDEAVRRAGAVRPLVVGDRLDTDVEGAANCGCPALLVLSGVTAVDDLARAPRRLRPAYLSVDIGGLLEPMPDVAVQVAADGAVAVRCRAAGAHLPAGAAALQVAGEGLDAVRAAVAACWAARDAGRPLPALPDRLRSASPLPRAGAR
jgi:glycerol 3-phosphatase-2